MTEATEALRATLPGRLALHARERPNDVALREKHLGVRPQPRLGVAHRGEGLRVVRRAPVALAVHDRVAAGEVLRHQHHRLVTGRVAVRVELADHVADRARGLLVLGPGREAELAHGVDDPPLHGLEPVRELGQRAVEDHVHRVVEVGLLREGAQRLPLDALEIERRLPALHATVARLPLSSNMSCSMAWRSSGAISLPPFCRYCS